MYKNVASQVLAVYAYDRTADTAKTGDAANITAYISKDGGAAAQSNDVNPTEISAANMPGVYVFTLTQAETNAGLVVLAAKSVTANIQIDPVAVYTKTADATLVDLVWDEVLTGATHNVATSAGRRLRELASNIIYSGTVASATNNTITLDAGASAVDGAYDPALIAIVANTGVGQSRLILEYDGATKTAVVDRNWKANPDATSEYVIYGHPGREHVNEGLAQAGSTSTTIKLNTLASSSDNAYNNQFVFIRSGTGDDQGRIVTDYNGTTKVATVDRAWDTTPDATSAYIMIPAYYQTPTAIGTATWASATRTLTDASIVWTNATRTLTQSAASVTAAVSGSTISITRGDTLSASITGLGNISTRTKLWFTVKRDRGDPDSSAIIQIEETAGLVYLNGADASARAANGGITIDDATAGNVTITLTAGETKGLAVTTGLYYDIQMLATSTVTTLTAGTCNIVTDVTRAVS